MKVKQLIKKLSKVDPNLEVIIADINGSTPLADITEEMYESNNSYSGDIIHPDDIESYEVNAIGLWGVN